MFCDQKCLNESRDRFHKFECTMFAIALRNVSIEFKSAHALLRLIVESFSIAGSVQRLRELMQPNTDGNILDFDLSHEEDEAMEVKHLRILNILKPNPRETENIDFAFLILKPILGKIFVNKSDFEFMKKTFKRAYSIRQLNSYNFGNVDANHGVGIYPFGSFFSHSCDPNVGRTSFEDKIVFVVMKPVAKGEQLFVHYV
jgi:hypothetical protein